MCSDGPILAVSTALLELNEIGGRNNSPPFFWDNSALATGPADAYEDSRAKTFRKEVVYNG
jgi:hypothetical protein